MQTEPPYAFDGNGCFEDDDRRLIADLSLSYARCRKIALNYMMNHAIPL